MLHNFTYVSPAETAPIKAELIEIIHLVQDEVRKYFTFTFWFVGSSKRNMITRDQNSNIGYDFDINIQVNDEDEVYSAEKIKRYIRIAFDKIARRYGYDYCEDSTRVLTMKCKDRKRSCIVHSCDIAIVYDCSDGRQQYIHFNKAQNSYTWQYQPQNVTALDDKIKWLKKNRCWDEVREYYIYKKNCNDNPHKHSRSIFAETVADVCNWYGYNNP